MFYLMQEKHWHPLGGSILVKYSIKMLQRASDDLDNIYNHIADDFKEIGTAEKMVVIVTVRYTPSSF